MTTDTQLAPTNAEIAALYTEQTGFILDDSPAALLDFARAVLAKWGQHAHSGEPVATVQMVHGVTIGYLETAVPIGTKLYAAPQPSYTAQAADSVQEDAAQRKSHAD